MRIEEIFNLLNRVPEPMKSIIRDDLVKIQNLLINKRNPRILIVGRRGAGKSSLINAIFSAKVANVGSVLSETGKPEWHCLKGPNGSIDILDTRGIGDRTTPNSSEEKDYFEEIKASIEEKFCDVILFLCKAKDVDSHVSEDINQIHRLKEFVFQTHQYEIPVIPIVTQVDELDPKREEPPYKSDTKLENIKTAVHTIDEIFKEEKIGILKVFPVSAYAEYDTKNFIEYNNFWNIDELRAYLMRKLPDEAKLEMARLSCMESLQKEVSGTIVNSMSCICAGIALTPIPVADILPITSAQILMIMGIAYVAGRQLDKKTAKDFMCALGVNVGVGAGFRELARSLIKMIPAAGSAISSVIAASSTWGIGQAAIAYFIDEKSIDEVNEIKRKAIADKKKELEPKENETQVSRGLI